MVGELLSGLVPLLVVAVVYVGPWVFVGWLLLRLVRAYERRSADKEKP